MQDKNKFREKIRRQRLSPEILAMEESEDKRLNRLGIDPDADPIEIIIQLKKILAERADDDLDEE